MSFQLVFRNLPFGLLYVDFVNDVSFLESMDQNAFSSIFDAVDTNG